MIDEMTQTEDELLVIGYDRALTMAKRLKRILQDELGQDEVRLHMCQKAVAAGLGCEHPHAMSHASYPRPWNGDDAIDLLLATGFVVHEDVAVEAVDRMEERVRFVPRSEWRSKDFATVQ